MSQICPRCGAELPEEAHFCPYCTARLISPIHPVPPRHIPHRLVNTVVFLLTAVFAVAGICFCFRPKTYEGQGEVLYKDEDGTYRLIVTDRSDPSHPMEEITAWPQEEDRSRLNLFLYITQKDTGADVSDAFLQKTERYELLIQQPEDSPDPVTKSAYHSYSNYLGVSLEGVIYFSSSSTGPIRLTHVLHMKNGNTIRISSDLSIQPSRIYHYSQHNAPLSTSQDLQTLLQRLAQEIDPQDVICIQLPPVTYTEPLILPGRTFILTGAPSQEGRTCFAAGIQMEPQGLDQHRSSYFTDLDLIGSGQGTGLRAAGYVQLKNCRFSHWETAIDCSDDAWVTPMGCSFEANHTGLYYHANEGMFADPRFYENQFTNNGTAVRLEKQLSQISLDFSKSVFQDNQYSIQNSCGQKIQTKDAFFY